uniref:Uncharacterized protein n=1 Tax=Dendroctonus ponderosae TaxID=77166 RepID=A0AAR5QCG3_DENPD
MLNLIFAFFIFQATIFVSGFRGVLPKVEPDFQVFNREELSISQVSQDPTFQSNITVAKWKTLNTGHSSFTLGVTNNTMINILFSNLSMHGAHPTIISRVFDLKVPVNDLEIFNIRSNGQTQVFIVVHVPGTGFEWYTVTAFAVEKCWTWPMEHAVSTFFVSKNQNKYFLFASLSSKDGTHFVVAYRFNISTKTYWYHQSINLPDSSPSMCLSSVDNHLHLSLAQPASNSLAIYHFIDQAFVLLKNLAAPEVDQVVCFENGFRYFVAFNGLSASILEITKHGLVERNVVNSNFEGLEFWLPISINTYRDETVLMLQRKLNHSTHSSFDVDAITFNGNRFEEHTDVSCTLIDDVQINLSCLAELSPSRGIMGASYIAIGNHLSLIVPTEDQTPVIFSVAAGLKKNEHPTKNDLNFYKEQKMKIELMMESGRNAQPASLAQHVPSMKKASVSDGNDSFLNDGKKVLDELEQLNQRFNENLTELKFNTIVFNGAVEIENNLTVNRWDSDAMEGLLSNLVQKNQLDTISDQKVFHNLTVGEFTVPIVNGVAAQSFAKTIDAKVETFGNIVFEKVLEAETVTVANSVINQIPLTQFGKLSDIFEDTLSFEELRSKNGFTTSFLNHQKIHKCSQHSNGDSLEFPSLFIPGNATIHSLNGDNFADFMEEICVNNVKCFIDKLKLIGKMDATESIQTTYLDGLSFPEEFIEREPVKPLMVTGQKYFQNHILGNNVNTTNQTVNAVDFKKIFTGGTHQNITGNFSFDHLEVADDFDFKGSPILETGMLKPNLCLDETANMQSNAEFLDLEVLGDIIVKTEFNAVDFNYYLENFISKRKNATITGLKIFQHSLRVKEDFQVYSGMINNITLNSTVTENFEEVFEINTFLDHIQFQNLLVHGLFNKQNISDLYGSLIKLEGNQSISSELIFDEYLQTDEFAVDQLNEDSTVGVEALSLEQADAERVEVQGNLVGNISNPAFIPLQEGNLNFVDDQLVTGAYNLSRINVEILTAKTINGVSADNVFSSEKLYANVTDILTYRNATIESLSIDRDIAIYQLNNISFRDIINSHPWVLLRHNLSSVVIEGDTHFKTVQIDKLSNKNFNNYISSLVFKNQTDITISNSVWFQNGLTAIKLVETASINGVLLGNIFRTTGSQLVVGSLHVTGNIWIPNEFLVEEMVNDVHVTNIFETFYIEQDTLNVKGEYIFPRLPYITNLTIQGPINSINYFNTIKEEFVYLNHNPHLEDDVVFQSSVHLKGNLGTMSGINEINLSELLSRAVWITQDTHLEGPVAFKHSLECMKPLKVKQQLITKSLFNENLQDLVNNGVFIDKGILKGPYFFDEAGVRGKFYARFLNDIDMNLIIPLKTEQNISRLDVDDMQLTHDVAVGQHVHGKILMMEKVNTFSRNIEQHVDSKIVFSNNVLVEKTLTAFNLNNKSVSDIVTTNTDQNLTATYNFMSKVVTNDNLIVEGLINDINLTSWEIRAVPIESSKPQQARLSRIDMRNQNLSGPLNGGATLNNRSTTDLLQKFSEMESYLDGYQETATDFKDLCEVMTDIYNGTQNQISKFRYFEDFQSLQFPTSINYIKYISHGNEHYLLVNEENSCFSEIWKLFPDGFAKTKTIETGSISQLEMVHEKNRLLLVSSIQNIDGLQCNIEDSTILWKWINEELEVIAGYKQLATSRSVTKFSTATNILRAEARCGN